jgi:protease I
MTNELQGVRVAFAVANEGIEQIELLRPRRAVIDAGGTASLVAPQSGMVETMRHLDRADLFPVDQTTDRARPAGYDAVVLPGGVANPVRLRTDGAAVHFLVAKFEAGKPVAAICHGPWTLIEGDLVAGRTLTSWPSLQTDLRNAGAYWVDREVVVCPRHQHVGHQPRARGPRRLLPRAHCSVRAGRRARLSPEVTPEPARLEKASPAIRHHRPQPD